MGDAGRVPLGQGGLSIGWACASVGGMRKPFFLSVGVAVLGSLVVVACVGESTAPPAAAQGNLDGPCFANGTCNTGLRCDVIQGAAKCAPVGDASPGDASPDGDGAATDSGLPECSFKPTSYPCSGGATTSACYGATQTCTITGCSGIDDLAWSCFSPNQCSTLACCLPASNASLTSGKNCAQGALAMTPGATSGASCGVGATCSPGDTQLCQFNAQCPAGKVCSAVRLVSLGDGGIASLNGVVIGACGPP